MKTAILVTGILFIGTVTGAAEQPEPETVSARTSHWTVEGKAQPEVEPLYDFPISRALGVRVDYEPEPSVEQQVEPRRIFSFYIADAR